MITTPTMTGPGEQLAVWVYAVAEHFPADSLSELTGVGGEPVRAVPAAGLTAAAGTVRLAEYGEAALRRNLENLDWLDVTARAHHRVIDAVGRQVPVVPMRLATVYRDDGNLEVALAERAADFRAALERTGGRREWGVKVYAVPSRERATGPDQQAGDRGRAAARSGAEYLRRKRRELSAAEDGRRATAASADAIHAALCQLAEGGRLHPPHAPELAGSHNQMIMNGAYLLDAGQDDELTAAVAALAGQHPAVQIELTGPWPPYSFTGLASGADRA
jgi:hypothetical protein